MPGAATTPGFALEHAYGNKVRGVEGQCQCRARCGDVWRLAQGSGQRGEEAWVCFGSAHWAGGGGGHLPLVGETGGAPPEGQRRLTEQQDTSLP